MIGQEVADAVGEGLSTSLPYGLAAAVVAIVGRVVVQVFNMGQAANQRADEQSEGAIKEYKTQLAEERAERQAERDRIATDRKSERDQWAKERANLEDRIASIEARLAEQASMQAAFAQERAQWTIEKSGHEAERQQWSTERAQLEARIRHLEELIEPNKGDGKP